MVPIVFRRERNVTYSLSWLTITSFYEDPDSRLAKIEKNDQQRKELIVHFFPCSFAFRIEIPYCQHLAFLGWLTIKRRKKLRIISTFPLLRVEEKKTSTEMTFLFLFSGSLPYLFGNHKKKTEKKRNRKNDFFVQHYWMIFCTLPISICGSRKASGVRTVVLNDHC